MVELDPVSSIVFTTVVSKQYYASIVTKNF